MRPAYFERAIFLSWYCSKRDCAFCYLSSANAHKDAQDRNVSLNAKGNVNLKAKLNAMPNTKPAIGGAKAGKAKGRRSLSSIFAEAIICRACGWRIEFLSCGYNAFSDEELLLIIKGIYRITRQKQWLNLGALNEKQMRLFREYTEGVCGTVECIVPGLRERLCPSKPLSEIVDMFRGADKLHLKKAITIIIGLGESLNDFRRLKAFIENHRIQKITFYRLKPQRGTIFENSKGPESSYYAKWIKKTRKAFPKITIVAGSWLTHLNEIHLLLKAGADSVTKFPSIKEFNTGYAERIEDEVRKAGRRFMGTLTKLPEIDIERELNRLILNKGLRQGLKQGLRQEVREDLVEYIGRMGEGGGGIGV